MIPVGRCVVALSLIVALPPRVAFSLDQGSPDSTFEKVYPDSERCSVLTDQYRQAAAAAPPTQVVAEAAARGIDLCRAGNFAEGADGLAGAIRRIGETPAEPQAYLPLR